MCHISRGRGVYAAQEEQEEKREERAGGEEVTDFERVRGLFTTTTTDCHICGYRLPLAGHTVMGLDLLRGIDANGMAPCTSSLKRRRTGIKPSTVLTVDS